MTKQTLTPKERIYWLVEALPMLLALWIMAFGLVATLLLLLGQLRSEFVLILGLPAVVLVTRFAQPYLQSCRQKVKDTQHNRWNLTVLGGVTGWALFNSFFVAQHIITDRDPGVYANAGAWLISHINLNVATYPVFDHLHNVIQQAPGFRPHVIHGTVTLYAQGLHLLPIFLGLTGRLFGLAAMFHLNVIFGAIALLAIYNFGKHLVSPAWSALATSVLACSMPFIYFSRDTYTEPLATIFVFGGLSLIATALKHDSSRLWLLAGLVGGAVTLTRIDGFLVIAGLAAFIVLHLIFSDQKKRPETMRDIKLLSLGLAITALISLSDLALLSLSYFAMSIAQFVEEFGLIVLITIFGFIAVHWKQPADYLSWLDKYTKEWRLRALLWAIAIGVALLLTRPFWLVSVDELYQRTYAEYTTNMIFWYLGPLAIASIYGLVVAVKKGMRRYESLLALTLMVFLSTALVYLVNPSISPDQIWASRRDVPIILPGIAILAVYGLAELWRRFGRLRHAAAGMLLATIIILAAPLVTSFPLLSERDTAMLDTVNSLCKSLPPKAAVLWIGSAGTSMGAPTKTMCNKPSATYGGLHLTISAKPWDLQPLAAQVRKAGYIPVIGVLDTQHNRVFTQVHAKLTRSGPYAYTKLQQTYGGGPPLLVTGVHKHIELGIIQSDGSITPLKSN
ncbi:MAG TPA: glycosyltransferase family 39 protein [Candidatus Saccharimonadales bacterium]|nr:glycosyltransferase family 39 protein [Candidatus Saccharimonadales bacterium]